MAALEALGRGFGGGWSWFWRWVELGFGHCGPPAAQRCAGNIKISKIFINKELYLDRIFKILIPEGLDLSISGINNLPVKSEGPAPTMRKKRA